MSKFIISIGLINKYIYLPIIYMIVYMGMNFFWTYQVNNAVSGHLESFGSSLGLIYIYVIGSLFKYRRINNNNKIEKFNKKYFKDFSIFFAITLLYFVTEMFHSYYTDIGTDLSFKELYLKESVEIIFISLVTFFILKYKYYIHHFISIAVFVILSIAIDLILKNYQTANKATVIISILYVLVESIHYSYIKYLVEKKYYFVFDIMGILGTFNLIFTIIAFTGEIIDNKVKRSNSLIFQFYYFYREYLTWYMIIRFIIGFIIGGMILSTLEVIIIKELTPNYVIIGYALSKIPTSIIEIKENKNRWKILVISIVQIFSLLFYLEILEFNFCSLNRNTKKSIIERERNEFYTSQDIELDTEIELKGYEIGDIMERQELEEIEAKEEDKDNIHHF